MSPCHKSKRTYTLSKNREIGPSYQQSKDEHKGGRDEGKGLTPHPVPVAIEGISMSGGGGLVANEVSFVEVVKGSSVGDSVHVAVGDDSRHSIE